MKLIEIKNREIANLKAGWSKTMEYHIYLEALLSELALALEKSDPSNKLISEARGGYQGWIKLRNRSAQALNKL